MKKRIFSILLTVCMVITMVPTALATDSTVDTTETAQAVFAVDGEEILQPSYSWYNADDAEYTISTVADLMGLAKITQNKAATTSDSSIPADNFSEKTVKLAADLDLSGVNWLDVDSNGDIISDYRISAFAGTFDGQDHTISNLSFSNQNSSQTTGYDMGLFSAVVCGSVQNLTLNNVTAELTTKDRFGSLACSLTGTADDCHVKTVLVTGSNANTQATGIAAAGLICTVGDSSADCAEVSDCSASDVEISVEGYLDAGGLLGAVYGGGSVSACSALDVSIEAGGNLCRCGGLAGYASRSYNSTDKKTYPITMENSSAKDISITGVSNMDYVGGFVGLVTRGNSFSGCSVENLTIVGGTDGDDVIGQVGGFAANTQNGADTPVVTFEHCSVTGLDMTLTGKKSTSDSGVGGFASNFSTATTLSDCSATGKIIADITNGQIGGFVGNLGWANVVWAGVTLSNCVADVDLDISGADAVAGGFVGSAQLNYHGEIRDVVIEFDECIANGDVTNEDGVAGGFVGDGYRGTYTSCEATGNVTGATAGGFWGEVVASSHDRGVDSDIVISECEATGSVLGSESAGGFLGSATTSPDEGDSGSETSVSITGSSASPVVAGTSESTTVSSFLNSAENDENICLGGEENANTEAELTVTPKAETETIARDSNGSLLIPDSGAVIKRSSEDTGTEISGGSTIAEDGSIAIPAGGSYGENTYPNGAAVDANGAVKKTAVLILSANSGTVYTSGGTTTFTFSYDGDGVVTAQSADATKATVSVDQTAKQITVTGGSATGTVTITVSAAETDSYTAVSAEYNLTVYRYSGGSSSSGSTTYAVSTDSTKNGSISVSPKNASKGTTVTITVDPDDGYELDSLTVLDKDGEEVELTKKIDTKYTFKMPSGKVTVEATFAEIDKFENPFTDVEEGDYYYDAVLWAAENGITGGTSATTFSPNASCTRAQAVTFLWRAAGSPVPKGADMPFADVTEDAYYHDAVLWAMENGITSGTNAGSFSPDAVCTRAQIATFLWRTDGKSESDGEMSFTDVSSGDYFYEAVLWAVENGVTNGTGTTTFSPGSVCTRAQIVTFLWRAMAE